MPSNFIKEIISGGQTGVDRAALDVARELRIAYRGWCPKGRWAEDGAIPNYYLNMKETPSEKPEQRTEWNARDSDGTLIIVNAAPMGGTLYTIEMAQNHNKPYFVLDLSKEQKIDDIVAWLIKNNIHKLNIAGPRASQEKNIYQLAFVVIKYLLAHKLLNQFEQSSTFETHEQKSRINKS